MCLVPCSCAFLHFSCLCQAVSVREAPEQRQTVEQSPKDTLWGGSFLRPYHCEQTLQGGETEVHCEVLRQQVPNVESEHCS